MILSKSKISSINIDYLINDHIINKTLDELLIIVPTNRKIRYLKRDLISLSPDNAVAKLNLYTLSTFSSGIFLDNNNTQPEVLTEPSSAVLLNKAFSDTELKYFSNYKNGIPRGTLDRIKNVISEYKQNGIYPDNLLEESEKLGGSEKLKAIDIANVYSAYLKLSKELNVFETGDIYNFVLNLDRDEFKRSFTNLFGKIKKVVINGFDEFTLPEIEIINLTADLKSIDLFLVFDYYRYNPSLFSHLNNCYDKLKLKGFDEVEDTRFEQLRNFHQIVRKSLFKTSDDKIKQNTDVKLTVLKTSSPEEEIKTIAKEIKRLIVEGNTAPESIAVTFNLISDHSDIVRHIFTDYGIPFNLTDRFSLSQSPPVIAMVNFLEIMENNFYYKNIFRALTGRWIKIDELDFPNLIRVTAELKIISGYSNWVDTLNRTINEIKNNTTDEDDHFLPIEYYEKSLADINKIYNYLIPFKERKTINQFNEELKKLILNLNLPQRIVNDLDDYVEKNTKALTVFLETLDELFDLLNDEYGKEKTFPLTFFLTQIKTALQFSRYNIKERHNSGVLVTSVNELRGLSFDYLFLGGMTDGEFPTRYQPEIFFSGSYKKDELRHIMEERYHFYQTLSCANNSLYLSYALANEKKEFTVSSFLDEFTGLFKCEIKEAKDLEIFIYNKSELLKKLDILRKQLPDISFADYNISVDLIDHSINVDKNRIENLKIESEYTGYISNDLSDEAVNKLKEQSNKQYSASQLEEYAKCPFQYFLKRILMLETIEEPTEELESFELGSIIHSILYEFYKTIRQKEIVIKGCDQKTFDKAEKLLFAIAEKKIERLHLKTDAIFYDLEKIFGIAGNNQNSILYKFLEEEQQNDDGYLPSYFELEFGEFGKNDSKKRTLQVGDVKVRGKIDRIDIQSDQNRIKVIDYKLGGKKPAIDELSSGISLQLPLYLYASKKLLEAEINKDVLPFEAIIYSLKLGKENFGPKSVRLSGANKKLSEEKLIEDNEELIRVCEEAVNKYVKNITEGKFNLSELENRENKVCRFCDFISICRVQDIK